MLGKHKTKVRLVIDSLNLALFLGLLILPVTSLGLTTYRSVGNSQVLGSSSQNFDNNQQSDLVNDLLNTEYNYVQEQQPVIGVDKDDSINTEEDLYIKYSENLNN